jgi:aminopeptidase N
MDEGFTSFAESLVSEYYRGVTKSVVEQSATGTGPRKKNIDQNYKRADIFNGDDNPHSDAYEGYINLAKSRFEEPLTTHADHFETNYGYSVAAYSKGEVFMEQLGYIVGEPVRDRILHEYYNTWKFKHPNVNDFIRVAEKESNMQLDWYREYFVNTTKTINYKIDSIWSEGKGTKVRLRRVGYFPMPIDLMATYKDGSKHLAYIPMYLMFGAKENEYPKASFTKHEPWRWTNPTYEVLIDKPLTEITSLEIDPTKRLADIDRNDNKLEFKW